MISLFVRLQETICALSTLEQNPPLARQLESWLEGEAAFWLPPINATMKELNLSLNTPGLVESLAAWFVLHYTAGPLDNLVDDDKDMGMWSAISPGETVVLSLALIGEALALIPVELGPNVATAFKYLTAALRDASQGQLLDLRGDVSTLDEYEAVLRLKSAAIFRSLFEILGAIGEAPPEVIQQLSQFGEAVGVLLQVSNDMQGIWDESGAYQASDLRKPQKTLPLLFALQLLESQPKRRAELETLLDAPPPERDVDRIREIIEGTPAKRLLGQMLLQWWLLARQAVSFASPEGQQKYTEWLSTIQPLDKNHSGE